MVVSILYSAACPGSLATVMTAYNKCEHKQGGRRTIYFHDSHDLLQTYPMDSFTAEAEVEIFNFKRRSEMTTVFCSKMLWGKVFDVAAYTLSEG